MIRSVQKCAVCVLKEQGVLNAEELVLQQYVQLDPTKPPIPRSAEGEEVVFALFPEEKQADGVAPSSGGVMGTAKALYRAIGFAWDQAKVAAAVPESRKTAVKRRKTTLYD